jgi:uncharacterized protein YggE
MKLIATLFALSAVLFFQACNSGGADKHKIILLKSTGEVAVKPNEASISITLECNDMNIKNSKDCLITKSNKLNEDLLKFGIKQKDILTTAINQYKNYNWENNSNVFTGYKSSMTTLVTIRDFKILENLYAGLLTNENITVGNLSYSHSNMDSLNNLAYQNALDKSNVLAEQLLKKMDKSEKEILRIANIDLPSVQDDNNEYIGKQKVLLAESNANSADININSGTVYVYQTLVVEYKIK